jgi:tetratricopeptide (TPR) repeat protein
MHYAAFISYSHRDRRWAEWLHRNIESYRLPPGVISASEGELSAARLKPVFLDRAELPTSASLADSVTAALTDSAALIVICSPAAAQSRWVNEEVRAYKSLGRGSRIYCLVVDGEPGVGDCFPPALRFEIENGELTARPAPEPMAADVRTGKDERALARLKIVAGLVGVPLDRLRQRDQLRRQRRLTVIAALASVGCIAFGALAVVALRARTEALRQRAVAEQQSLTARRTTDFMKSLFAVSDPSEARGNTITAREMLDRGARQIDSGLAGQPLVRAELATTLGEVYANLGLYNQGLSLLDSAVVAARGSADTEARNLVAIAELQVQRRDYPGALAALGAATQALSRALNPDAALRVRALCAYGDVYYSTDDAARSRKYFSEALALASQSAAGSPGLRARAREGVAQADLEDGKFDQAATGFQQALAEQEASSGELHPRVSEILNELGSLEYLRGRSRAAIPYFRRCLTIERQIYGEHNALTASAANNLARVVLEQRDFAQAEPLLRSAIASISAGVPETSDDMAFYFANLALVRMGVGDLASAQTLFEKGLKAAILNKHRLHGPILGDLADLECRSGRNRAGLARLDEARAIVVARYPDDPWRAAQIDNVRAGCLTGLRRYPEAGALMQSSLPVILKKWPADTLFGHDALERAVRLYTASGDATRVAQYRSLGKIAAAGQRTGDQR